MKIEFGKFYKTRNGRKVRIYTLNGRGFYSIHGAVLSDDWGWMINKWSPEGLYLTIGDNDLDIVAEWPDPWTIPVPLGPEHWFNYPRELISIEKQNIAINLIKAQLITPTQALDLIKIGGLDALATTCSCGGKINSHKPNCPEDQTVEITIPNYPYYYVDEAAPPRKTMTDLAKKCECGSEAVGSSKHSAYCPKFKKED